MQKVNLLNVYTEEQLNNIPFVQDQLHAVQEAILKEAQSYPGDGEDDWPEGPNFSRHNQTLETLTAVESALEKLLKGVQRPTGVKMNLTREDGKCLFVEENAKKFPAAPLRAILLSQKGKLERGVLGDLEYFYFRYVPHDSTLPEEHLEVNLKWQDVEEILERANSMLQQLRNR